MQYDLYYRYIFDAPDSPPLRTEKIDTDFSSSVTVTDGGTIQQADQYYPQNPWSAPAPPKIGQGQVKEPDGSWKPEYKFLYWTTSKHPLPILGQLDEANSMATLALESDGGYTPDNTAFVVTAWYMDLDSEGDGIAYVWARDVDDFKPLRDFLALPPLPPGDDPIKQTVPQNAFNPKQNPSLPIGAFTVDVGSYDPVQIFPKTTLTTLVADLFPKSSNFVQWFVLNFTYPDQSRYSDRWSDDNTLTITGKPFVLLYALYKEGVASIDPPTERPDSPSAYILMEDPTGLTFGSMLLLEPLKFGEIVIKPHPGPGFYRMETGLQGTVSWSRNAKVTHKMIGVLKTLALRGPSASAEIVGYLKEVAAKYVARNL